MADDDRPAVDAAVTLDPPLSAREPARTWIAWELMRPTYNALLLAAFLVLLQGGGPSDGAEWRPALKILVAANVAYLLEPLAELGMRRRGVAGRWPRPALFLAGAAFSLYAAAVMLTVTLLSDF